MIDVGQFQNLLTSLRGCDEDWSYSSRNTFGGDSEKTTANWFGAIWFKFNVTGLSGKEINVHGSICARHRVRALRQINKEICPRNR